MKNESLKILVAAFLTLNQHKNNAEIIQTTFKLVALEKNVPHWLIFTTLDQKNFITNIYKQRMLDYSMIIEERSAGFFNKILFPLNYKLVHNVFTFINLAFNNTNQAKPDFVLVNSEGKSLTLFDHKIRTGVENILPHFKNQHIVLLSSYQNKDDRISILKIARSNIDFFKNSILSNEQILPSIKEEFMEHNYKKAYQLINSYENKEITTEVFLEYLAINNFFKIEIFNSAGISFQYYVTETCLGNDKQLEIIQKQAEAQPYFNWKQELEHCVKFKKLAFEIGFDLTKEATKPLALKDLNALVKELISKHEIRDPFS